MPLKDPTARLAYARRWYQRNRERLRAYALRRYHEKRRQHRPAPF